MKNKIFEDVRKQVEAWTQEKDAKEKKLRADLAKTHDAVEEAEKNAEAAIKADDLETYRGAQVSKMFCDSRIDHLTEELSRIEEGHYITQEQHSAIYDTLNNEQLRLLGEQNEKLRELAKQAKAVVEQYGELMTEGNKVIVALNLLTEREDIMKNTFNNRSQWNIADNFLYDVEVWCSVPSHRKSLRYSKYLGGVPFADEV